MDRNQGNRRPSDTDGQRPPQTGSDSHNLGNMDDDEARRARRQGGETSSREQDRDEQGQFAGTGRSDSNRGGPNGGQGRDDQGQFTGSGSRGGSTGGSHSGGSQGGSHGGNQGGSNR